MKDRAYVTPLVVGVILLLILFILGANYIRLSEIQVTVRYSSFGITKFYKEQWFYQFTFMAFGLLVYVAHMLVGLKLYKIKGREFTIAFQWLTVAILAITVIIIGTLFWVTRLS